MSFSRILIAVEASPIAAHAIDVGIELAQSLKAQVALIRVTVPPGAEGADAGVSAGDLLAREKREDQRLLDSVRVRLNLAASVQEFLCIGEPTLEIVKAAKEWPADLIVIGSHGRSGFSRILLGSVAEAVIREAPCPVLVVRANK
jgi:universal stress protein A